MLRGTPLWAPGLSLSRESHAAACVSQGTKGGPGREGKACPMRPGPATLVPTVAAPSKWQSSPPRRPSSLGSNIAFSRGPTATLNPSPPHSSHQWRPANAQLAHSHGVNAPVGASSQPPPRTGAQLAGDAHVSGTCCPNPAPPPLLLANWGNALDMFTVYSLSHLPPSVRVREAGLLSGWQVPLIPRR